MLFGIATLTELARCLDKGGINGLFRGFFSHFEKNTNTVAARVLCTL